MAAADREYPHLVKSERWRIIPATNDDLFYGWMVAFKASQTYIEEASNTASSPFAGVILATCLNASGSAGGENALVCREGAIICEGGTTLAATPGGQGDVAYASDGITLSHSGNNKVGRVIETANLAVPYTISNPVMVAFGVLDLV